VVDFIIRNNNGKVLVHCHAGMGRTALLVGAYLLYSGIATDDKDAIKIAKASRPKCFEKSYNVKFMKEFNHYLKNLRMIFPASLADSYISPTRD
jgi:protein tyrosine phosphatase domain-containing protein 1